MHHGGDTVAHSTFVAPVVSGEAGCQRTLLPPWAQGRVKGAGTLSTGWQSQAPGLLIQDVPRGFLLTGCLAKTGHPSSPTGAALKEHQEVGGLCWPGGARP